MDGSTGLLYIRARYYSPHIGRFLTKDTVTGKDSGSQSLNRYIYALNNPLDFSDVSGLSATELSLNSFRVAHSTPAFIFVSHPTALRIPGNNANSTMAVCTDCSGISIVDAVSFGLVIVDILDSPISPEPDTSLIAVELESGQIAFRGGVGPVVQGQAGVARAISEYEAAGGHVFRTEISLKAGGGLTRPDIYDQSAEGFREFIEVKNGSGAALNPNQARLFPIIEQSGAVPVGGNAARAGLVPGVPIPPTPVRVITYP